MLVYAEMRGTYDRKVAYIFAYKPTKFEENRWKIRGFMVKTLTCGRLLAPSLKCENYFCCIINRYVDINIKLAVAPLEVFQLHVASDVT